ncbi:MAG: aminotransferase class V-fold PLP-dependent enzyme [Pseudonocardia sp.]
MAAGETLDGRWRRWGGDRPPSELLHLDSASAGRSSEAVLAATAGHARRAAQIGAYVAQAQAEPEIETCRATLAGLLGTDPDGVAFVESASAARTALLAAWPWRAGDTIGVQPGEWGPNLEAFAAQGLDLVGLPADGDGHLDLEGLERMLAGSPPAVVHLTQVASHRGLVQPVAAAAAMCRAAGVPLWVDAAQALGHVDTATGADVVYATSRKWLAGPRGVGVLAVAPTYRDALRVVRSALQEPDLPPVRYLESGEAHVAGRVGLAHAVAEHVSAGVGAVRARLAEVGRATRAVLDDLPGWSVAGSTGEPCAVTSLRPLAGQDVAAVRARLLDEHRILTTACTPARAPREGSGHLLRISPHVDAEPAALARLAVALRVAGAPRSPRSHGGHGGIRA